MRFLVPRRLFPITITLGVCLLLGAHSRAGTGLLPEVARLARGGELQLEPRFSISPASGHKTDVRSRRKGGGRAVALARRVADAVHGGSDPGSFHAAAMLELLWADSGDVTRVDQAIGYLVTASRVAEPSAPLLSDLAGAHLVRAEWAESPGDLFTALEFAARAAALQPEHPAARFNLALALDRLALDDQAAAEWRALIRLDRRSQWARHARARLAVLGRYPVYQSPLLNALASQHVAFALRDPQQARLVGMDSLLGLWGQAVISSDTLLAHQVLSAVEVTGEALTRRGGDRTLADAVRAIRKVERAPASLRTLAWAHDAYSRAQRALVVRETETALALFDSIRSNDSVSPILRQWAAYSRSIAFFYKDDYRESRQASAATLAGVDTSLYPALAGRASWSLATLHLRDGRYAEAHTHLAHAAALFEQAGESEHLGAMQAMDAETWFGLGDNAAGFAAAQRGLAALRPYRGSLRLHNLLFALVKVASTEGLGLAALRLQDEDVAVASRLRLQVQIEARLSRARALTEAGELARAQADVREVRPLVAAMPPSDERNWLEADVALTAAGVSLRVDPAGASPTLESAVRYFSGLRVKERLVPALAMRAEARLASGNEGGAVSDLNRAAALLDSLAAGLESAALRASMLEAGRAVFDRLALVHARAGRGRDALQALERGRASFGGGHGLPATPRPALRGPSGEVVLDYGLIGDTLLALAVTGDTVQVAIQTVDADALLRTADRATLALELRLPADSAGPALAALYDLLVRPHGTLLPAQPRLVIIADGEVARIPFHTLRDTASGRYLIQDHVIRFAASLRDAQRPPLPPEGADARVLFVADPAFDPAEHPGLVRLGGLAAGVRHLAAGYRSALVLPDTAAREPAVVRAMGGTSVVHFAGHAVFDDVRPSRSYLVLAAGGGDGRLTASELGEQDLSRARLVVLSACQTHRSGLGRSGGFAGLSGAMLSAGAGGVIGSLWRVDDGFTRELMAAFHPAYLRSGDAAVALRQAQLQLLRSPNPALRSPAAWAGFRYTGR